MKIKQLRPSEQGFTLIETVAALVIFLIILGFMIPIFADQGLKTINNEIKTGAVTVSQQILDQLRQADPISLPRSGATTTLPDGTSTASIAALGKTYSTTITYCENTTYCNAETRHIKVQVSHHGQTIYTVETVYTRLQ